MGDECGHDDQRRHIEGYLFLGMDGFQHQVRSPGIIYMKQVVQSNDSHAAHRQQPDDPWVCRPAAIDKGHALAEQDAHQSYQHTGDPGHDEPSDHAQQIFQKFLQIFFRKHSVYPLSYPRIAYPRFSVKTSVLCFASSEILFIFFCRRM